MTKDSKSVYRPQPGSVPFKVLQFLSDNPDEELTREDVATKFDTAPAGVDTLLKLAKTRGAITSSRNADLQIVWSLGSLEAFSLVAAEEAIAPAEAKNGQARDLVAAKPATEGRVMPFDSEISQGDEFSLIPGRSAQRLRDLQSYWEWFGRFAPGDIAKFDLRYLRDVAGLAGKYGRETSKEFRCARIDANTAVITRRK